MQVGVDARAVNPFPDERIVGKRLAAVIGPKDLLRGKVLDATAAHDLRQRAGVPEHIGQPEDLALDAELVAEEAFAVEELADQALAAGDVGIGLDPHTAFGDELPGLDRTLDAPVQVGVVVFDHPVEMGLALQEAVLRVFCHQR